MGQKLFNTVKRKGRICFVSFASSTTLFKLRTRARVGEFILKNNFKSFIATILRKKNFCFSSHQKHKHTDSGKKVFSNFSKQLADEGASSTKCAYRSICKLTLTLWTNTIKPHRTLKSVPKSFRKNSLLKPFDWNAIVSDFRFKHQFSRWRIYNLM